MLPGVRAKHCTHAERKSAERTAKAQKAAAPWRGMPHSGVPDDSAASYLSLADAYDLLAQARRAACA